jgi:hypothetical protein
MTRYVREHTHTCTHSNRYPTNDLGGGSGGAHAGQVKNKSS